MNSELILYTTEDGVTKVDVTFVDETVWLTQEQMADLFQKSKSTINEHIKNIYLDGELNENSTMRKFGNSEFSTKPTNYYNLDMIISVLFRQTIPKVNIGSRTMTKKWMQMDIVFTQDEPMIITLIHIHQITVLIIPAKVE